MRKNLGTPQDIAKLNTATTSLILDIRDTKAKQLEKSPEINNNPNLNSQTSSPPTYRPQQLSSLNQPLESSDNGLFNTHKERSSPATTTTTNIQNATQVKAKRNAYNTVGNNNSSDSSSNRKSHNTTNKETNKNKTKTATKNKDKRKILEIPLL